MVTGSTGVDSRHTAISASGSYGTFRTDGVIAMIAVGDSRQRVAVGRAARDHRRADAARGAGLVLDDHLLAERRAQLVGIEPRHLVGRAAGAVGHDQPDGLGGPGRLRAAARGQQGGQRRLPSPFDDRSFVSSALLAEDSARHRRAMET